jgi:hypothetical protein
MWWKHRLHAPYLPTTNIRIYGLDSDPVMFYPSSPAVGKREITTVYVTWLHQIDRWIFVGLGPLFNPMERVERVRDGTTRRQSASLFTALYISLQTQK